MVELPPDRLEEYHVRCTSPTACTVCTRHAQFAAGVYWQLCTGRYALAAVLQHPHEGVVQLADVVQRLRISTVVINQVVTDTPGQR